MYKNQHHGIEILFFSLHFSAGNEGKYNFDLDDWTYPDKIVFELAVPKCRCQRRFEKCLGSLGW